jgi:hypothetical protein
MTRPRKRVTRRHVLQAGAGSLFIPFALKAGQAPAQGGKSRLRALYSNISGWALPTPAESPTTPEFTERPGIKVNYDTPGFPVYNHA